jgi:hypothetical protein
VLPKPALAKDKRRQEEAAAEQCRLDIERFMAPVMAPDPVDVAIRHIQANCALSAAPLDAILAKIEHDDIAHKARAPPRKTSPHPATMLSTPPCPMTYVGTVLSTMEGNTRVASLALALSTLPSPTVDSQLQMVHQCA